MRIFNCYLRSMVIVSLLLALPFLALAQKIISGKVLSSKEQTPVPWYQCYD